jgi:hypothetical protein
MAGVVMKPSASVVSGDADLATGQLGGELPQRGQDGPGAPALPASTRLLDGGPVEGDERELGRHEEGGADREDDAGEHSNQSDIVAPS